MNQLESSFFLKIVCINLSLVYSMAASGKAAEDNFKIIWVQACNKTLEEYGRKKFKELDLKDLIEIQKIETEHGQQLEERTDEAWTAEDAENKNAKGFQEKEKALEEAKRRIEDLEKQLAERSAQEAEAIMILRTISQFGRIKPPLPSTVNIPQTVGIGAGVAVSTFVAILKLLSADQAIGIMRFLK
jgi:hypothetical protein